MPLNLQPVDPAGVLADDSLPPLQANLERLAQALKNLVSNAPAHGQITLTAQNGGDNVRLQGVDTGSGIDPEALPHIFNRFYRADAAASKAAENLVWGWPLPKLLLKRMAARFL